MSVTYREHFAEPAKAAEYERAVATSRSYDTVLWEVEKLQLKSIIDALRKSHPRIEYLDFAAGTGRLASFVEGLVDASTAIEISPAMLEVARRKLTRTTMINADITPPGTPIEGKYDLITAFRFVLNAEPGLRLLGLKALAARLRGPSSILVFNNHGNLLSHKMALWPYHRLKNAGKGWRPEGNCMTTGDVRRVAAEAGLKIEKVLGCGLLSAKIASLMKHERAIRWETALSRTPFHRWGSNQMYIARLADAGADAASGRAQS